LESQEIEEIRESQRMLLVVREKLHVLSDCATVAVMFQARSVMSYFGLFGLDFYYLFCYF